MSAFSVVALILFHTMYLVTNDNVFCYRSSGPTPFRLVFPYYGITGHTYAGNRAHPVATCTYISNTHTLYVPV